MSYLLEPTHPKPRWVLPLLVVIALAAAGLYIAGRNSITHQPAPDGEANPAVSWSTVGPWRLPVSTQHGPFRQADDLASGFSHDELGAALAAIHISYRLTAEAGPMVSETTARRQTFGDLDTALAELRTQPLGGSAPPAAFLYRVLAGEPTGSSVLVSIAVRSPDSAARGGWFVTQHSVAWRDGDWRLAVPMSHGRFVPDLPGYRLVGRTDV